MRALTFIVMMGLGLSSFAEGTNTSTDTTSIASPSVDFNAIQSISGTVADSSYGMGVRCSEPTLTADHTRLSSGTEAISVGISIGLGPAFNFISCEKSARQVRWFREMQIKDMQHAQELSAQAHAAKAELTRQETIRVKMIAAQETMKFYKEHCIPAHGRLSLDKNSAVYGICREVSSLVDQHAKGMRIDLMPVGHGRVSPTKWSKGE